VRRLRHHDDLEIRLGELHPVVSEAFRRRLASWVERILRQALADFASLAERPVAEE